MVELTKINWKQNGDKWTAFDENDNQIIGWLHDKLRDTWFYCYSDDICTGWFKDTDQRWYYFFPEQCVDYNRTMYKGEMKTGWLKDGDKWYYLIQKTIQSEAIYKGQMLQSTTEEISGIDYKFDDNGAMIEDCTSGGLSTEGAKFIESWEGFTSTWEDVGDHYWTIGIGTATSGTLGQKLYNSGISSCTHEQAYAWLQEESESCYKSIKAKLDSNGITLSQCQIDALISMAYNIGTIGLLGSKLFKNICNGVTDTDTITSNFQAWAYCNGIVWKGLLNRRNSEARLYLNGDYKGNN